jgi:hypothetical protein
VNCVSGGAPLSAGAARAICAPASSEGRRYAQMSLVAVALAAALAGVGCTSLSRHATPAVGAPAAGTAGAAASGGNRGVPGGNAGAAGANCDVVGPGASASGAPVASVEQYAAAIKANSQCSDQLSDGKVRADLATRSVGAADACLALAPGDAACQYGKAIATGMEARAHPARAVGLLSSMLQNLGNADSADPNYDEAGPSRVRALVLIRAPAWPIGPGDTDAGLAAARRAVSLRPDYPPNALALAEALSKTGDEKGARETYAHARNLAQALPSGLERDGWLHDAEDGLKQKQK